MSICHRNRLLTLATLLLLNNVAHQHRFYNLLHDDGVTLPTDPASNQSWSLKRSYLEVIAGIREVIGSSKVMLMNSLGYSSISFMKDIDGTFSEGKAINAVGTVLSVIKIPSVHSAACGRAHG
jgi:hypothetical protein